MGSRIDDHLAATAARISRVTAAEAAAMQAAGALLIDTRPQFQRERFGVVPGAVLIERNHLEWRVDPTSDHRHPAVVEHTGPIVVLCQEGYSSILAVGTLVDLGVPDVHELAGGFDAWVAAGLPVVGPAD
jgi:rhodanese-related sulfurtransferase